MILGMRMVTPTEMAANEAMRRCEAASQALHDAINDAAADTRYKARHRERIRVAYEVATEALSSSWLATLRARAARAAK